MDEDSCRDIEGLFGILYILSLSENFAKVKIVIKFYIKLSIFAESIVCIFQKNKIEEKNILR